MNYPLNHWKYNSCESKHVDVLKDFHETVGTNEDYQTLNPLLLILATEIQNIQIGDGDVARNIEIPIRMLFPRTFTCPTLLTTNFKIGNSFLHSPGKISLKFNSSRI